jgi:hypothetical protein
MELQLQLGFGYQLLMCPNGKNSAMPLPWREPVPSYQLLSNKPEETSPLQMLQSAGLASIFCWHSTIANNLSLPNQYKDEYIFNATRRMRTNALCARQCRCAARDPRPHAHQHVTTVHSWRRLAVHRVPHRLPTRVRQCRCAGRGPSRRQHSCYVRTWAVVARARARYWGQHCD